MGLVFTPLSSLALSGISRQKMAQASGLFNVIRQIGGSFGVAILGSMLTRRFIFHSTIYGEAVNAYSPAFNQAMSRLGFFAQHVHGGTQNLAAMQAKALASSHIMQQAFVSSIGDDFLLAGIITAACIFLVLFLPNRRRGKGKNAPQSKQERVHIMEE